jgi:UDP-N-acetyl-alpha-D-muramoyl-L-alanyl-L-glutamate epimerase
MTSVASRTGRFRYEAYDLDAARRTLTCHYRTDTERFTEYFAFTGDGDWSAPGVEEAARLVFLTAGVSYFKTTAAPVVDLGDLATTALERDVLRRFYHDGLAEFAYRNDLDLDALDVVGPDRDLEAPDVGAPGARRPLVPFGGGIDSIVTVELLKAAGADATLFVVERPGARFDAIEAPAAVTGLPVVRVERSIDAKVLNPAGRGYLHGHVPVTGIISTLAVLQAVVRGHDAVVMSNEASASVPTLVGPAGAVNHQYSKSEAFERDLRALLAASIGSVEYFSALRARSELWVAERFAALGDYHRVFRSCNRAFALDPARRAATWCARCDKCCFVDLVLAPFLAGDELGAIFSGHEPLRNADLLDQFRALLGLGDFRKPFECVGDTDECRSALQLLLAGPRGAEPVIAALGRELGDREGATLEQHLGPDHVPERYATLDLLG